MDPVDQTRYRMMSLMLKHTTLVAGAAVDKDAVQKAVYLRLRKE